MSATQKKQPTYRLHAASGQAVVTIDGKDHYLGRHDSKESKDEYDRLIGEWLAGGRKLVKKCGDILIAELVDAFWHWAKEYYVLPLLQADGSPTIDAHGEPMFRPSGELENYRDALRPLLRLYRQATASNFGPIALAAVRDEMVRLGWCRNVVNRQLGRIKAVFRWAVSRELIPPSVDQALSTVAGLHKGKSKARESAPVKPVPQSLIPPVLNVLSPELRTMVQLQLLTGMRPGEVCQMRSCDIDTTDKLWLYRPASHKTEHHDIERVVPLGPKAQELLQPWLRPELTAFIFSPTESETRRRAEQHANRKTPLSCGNSPGTNRKRRPRRRPGDRYETSAYRRAIYRACDKAFPLPEPLARQATESPDAWKARLTSEQLRQVAKWQREHRWSVNRLRHNAATQFRKQFGLEAARVLLGHQTTDMTEVYAEKDLELAGQIMSQVG